MSSRTVNKRHVVNNPGHTRETPRQAQTICKLQRFIHIKLHIAIVRASTVAILRLHAWKMVPTSGGLRGLRDKSLVSAGTKRLVLCPLWTSIAGASTHLCGPRKREYGRPPGRNRGARGFQGRDLSGRSSPGMSCSKSLMHADTCTGLGSRLQ